MNAEKFLYLVCPFFSFFLSFFFIVFLFFVPNDQFVNLQCFFYPHGRAERHEKSEIQKGFVDYEEEEEEEEAQRTRRKR